MSIAVSTVIKPSRILSGLVIGMSLGPALLCVVLACGQLGTISFYPRLFFLVGSLLIALVGITHVIRSRKSRHIDISGNGQIKVEEDITLASSRQLDGQALAREHKVAVKLMPNSTIWPFLLLLRLQAEDQVIRSWVILPDCMSSESFRKLSVAVRWIAAHNDQAERKIL